jgi:hypothetical protein
MKGYMKHYKIELKSNLFNLTCQKINHLMLEWEGKSLQERLDQTAKNNLVERVERIIISAHEVTYQAITTPTKEDLQQPMLDFSTKTVDNNNKASRTSSTLNEITAEVNDINIVVSDRDDVNVTDT